jgi:SAM-dependent methyltransferase
LRAIAAALGPRRRRCGGNIVRVRRLSERSTFDAAAELYDRARPRYPEALFDTLIERTGLRRGDAVLEIGAGTGIATLPLARRGLVVTAIELGENLSAIARGRVAEHAQVEVINVDFEGWRPPMTNVFDVVVAATSWHWIDPSVGFRKVAACLRPGGHLAVWSTGHVFPPGGDDFFEQIQDVYDEIGEGLGPDAVWPTPAELAPPGLGTSSGGIFATTSVDRFDWEIVYDADAYIDLLNTFSGHLTMAGWQRDRLFSEIRRRLSLRPDGLLRRHWGAVLEIAVPVASPTEPPAPATR